MLLLILEVNMRIIIVGIFVLIFVIFSLPLFFIEWIVGKINMEAIVE